MNSRFQKVCMICSLLFMTLVIACQNQPVYAPPSYAGADVVLDIARLEEGAPLFFTHHAGAKKVSFFVLRIGDEITSYLDACNACYPHKRGYKQENGMMVCQYCKEKYPLAQLATGLGNCYPIRIPGRILEGKYLIPVMVLEKNAGKF